MYSISSRNENMATIWITSAEILASLDPIAHADHITRINHIEARGIRYSGEDFDVLCAARNAAISRRNAA